MVLLLTAASLPVFKSQLANVETTQGKNIEFDCQVEATPAPSITWYVCETTVVAH